MPSRWFRLLIVVFWLTTTAWLFWHDLWPSWRSGEPPPYHIDPVDEVVKGDPLRTFWTVQRLKQGVRQRIFRASTWVDYRPDDDTYILHASLNAEKDLTLQPVYVAKFLKIELVTSEYCVNRLGQLRSLEATVKTTPHPEQLLSGLSPLLGGIFRAPPAAKSGIPSNDDQISLYIWGDVQGDQFSAYCRAESPSLPKPLQFDLPSTTVSRTASVLMPLHPVNHIRGLRFGQTWRQPLVDPLRDAFASLPGLSGGVRALNARVLPQPEMLKIGDNEMSCLVIEYTDDEMETVGRTWVEQDSERVQQQEANLEDGLWIMRRELPPRSSRRPPKG